MAQFAERIVQAIEAERLAEGTGHPADEAYNQAIDDALAAVEAVAAEPDPLRELAEWLVSLDDPKVRRDLPYHLSESAAVVLAARARYALGHTEEG